MNIEEIKSELAKQEKALANKNIFALMGEKVQAKVDGLKKQLSELEGKAEVKVEEAEKKVEEAEKKVDEAKAEGDKTAVKEAVAELKEAKADEKESKADEKEVEAVAKQLEKVEDKADKAEAKAKSSHGGAGRGQGRKRIEREPRVKSTHGGAGRGQGRKASVPTKMVKPKGMKVVTILARKKKEKPAKKLSVRERLKSVAVKQKPKQTVRQKLAESKKKMKTVRAFGQVVEYKNDAEFCHQLIKAFKKRKEKSKKGGKRRKTKPVFGAITTSVKSAVSKALHNVSEKSIEKNPKAFLANAQKLEKSAIKFLEDFKNILGADYKKSEISAEFGELEKSIKAFVARVTNK